MSDNYAIKLPVQLVKRLADGPHQARRWLIELDDAQRTFEDAALQIDKHREEYFILIGPFKHNQRDELKKLALEEAKGEEDTDTI